MSNSRYRVSRGLPLETSASLELGCGSSSSQLFGHLESDAKLPNGPFFCVLTTNAARESEGTASCVCYSKVRLSYVFNSGCKRKGKKTQKNRELGGQLEKGGLVEACVKRA